MFISAFIFIFGASLSPCLLFLRLALSFLTLTLVKHGMLLFCRLLIRHPCCLVPWGYQMLCTFLKNYVQKHSQLQVFSWLFWSICACFLWESIMREISLYKCLKPPDSTESVSFHDVSERQRISMFCFRLNLPVTCHFSIYGSSSVLSVATHCSIIQLYHDFHNRTFSPLVMNTWCFLFTLVWL